MKKATILFLALIATLAPTALAEGGFSPFGLSLFTFRGHDSDPQFPAGSYEIYGLRLGLVNAGHAAMYGLAVSTFANSDDTAGGLQASAFYNATGNGDSGVLQISAFANQFKKGGNGLQIAGLSNIAEPNFNGLQVASFNFADAADGVQIGLINNAHTFSGIQIGMINLATQFQGVQLGLFNSVSSKNNTYPLIRLGW